MERLRRKNAIYKTAARILCNLGYERASIRTIAEATGMTKAGLYYYFKSKEDLLFQILDGYMDDLLDGAKALQETISDPLSLIQALIDFQIKVYCKDKFRSKLILHDENCLSGPWSDRIKEKEKEYLGIWRQALVDYCANEQLNTADLSVHVHLLVGMCNWSYQWYDPKKNVSPPELAQKIFDIFFNGWLNQENPSEIYTKKS